MSGQYNSGRGSRVTTLPGGEKFYRGTNMKKYRFRRWIRNWLYDDENAPQTGQYRGEVVSKESCDDMDASKAVRFVVWNAQGGRVIQINRYDPQKDRTLNNLYIIRHDQDFGEEINKILTMDLLR